MRKLRVGGATGLGRILETGGTAKLPAMRQSIEVAKDSSSDRRNTHGVRATVWKCCNHFHPVRNLP